MAKQLTVHYPNLNQQQKQLAYFYFRNQYIENLLINENENGYAVDANINVLGYKHHCSFEIDKIGSILNAQCDCQSELICSHIGAVLLKIEQLSFTEFPFQYQSNQLDISKNKYRLINEKNRKKKMAEQAANIKDFISNGKTAYQNILSTQLANEKIELEPVIHYDSNSNLYSVSYKIGSNKKYVISDITDFLRCIDNNAMHRYGKDLAFVHSMEAFDDFSKQQINFMKATQDLQYINACNNNFYSFRGNVHKEMLLVGKLLDQFFELYQDYDSDYLSLTQSNEKLRIDIDDEDEYYSFKIKPTKNIHSGQKHLYALNIQGKSASIEQIPLDENGNGLKFLEQFENNELFVSKEDYQNFYKYIISPIIDYFDLSSLPEIKGGEYQNTRIYGDIDDNSQIFFKLIYFDETHNKKLGFNSNLITTYQQDYVESMIKKYSSYIDTKSHLAYFDLNEEKTYTFLQEELDKLKEYAEVFVSESLKKLGHKTSYRLSVGVRVENDLLSIDIESLDIPNNELSKILDQYKRKKKFYRLKNGELIHLESPQFEELSELMDQYHIEPKNMKNGHIELNKNRMFTLDEDMNHLETITVNRKDSFKDTLDRFSQSSNKAPEIPTHYQSILRDYQKDGCHWLHTLYEYGFNGILADDMGLGKTLQVISLLESIHTDKPSLVICPSSLIYNWEDEVHKFSTTLPVTRIMGKPNERKDMILNIAGKHLYVTSYDYMRKDFGLYDNILFEYIILDEAQYIKNLKTKSAKSVKQLHASHKIALSGTPIENSLAELWSIMDFLMPQYLFNYGHFKKNYENDIVKNNDVKKIEKLKKMVSPFILRRNKKEVLTELPDKIEKTQIIPFNEEENELYLANLASANESLQEILKMEKVDSFDILALLTKLRQICCEPRLLFENIEQASSKMKACLEILTEAKENNQKVLLFSSFTSIFDLLEDELRELGITFFKLTGQTPKEERKNLVEQFQNGNADVFLISLKAGGTGLNLTKAEVVIHFDPWWNVSAQNQATDRAYRIGQHSNVQVYKLVMKNSIEEKIVALQEKKKELADLFVENNDGSIARMSKDEIRELFS